MEVFSSFIGEALLSERNMEEEFKVRKGGRWQSGKQPLEDGASH